MCVKTTQSIDGRKLNVGLIALPADTYHSANAQAIELAKQAMNGGDKLPHSWGEALFSIIQLWRASEVVISDGTLNLPPTIATCEINSEDEAREAMALVNERERMIDQLQAQQTLVADYVERYFDSLLMQLRNDQNVVLSEMHYYRDRTGEKTLTWPGIGGVGMRPGKESVDIVPGYDPGNDEQKDIYCNLGLLRRTVTFAVNKTEAAKLLDTAADEEQYMQLTDAQRSFLGKVQKVTGAPKPYWRYSDEKAERPIRLKVGE